MVRGSPIRADHDPPRESSAAAVGQQTDTSTQWAATLVHPQIVQRGSKEPVTIAVEAPVMLNRQRVSVRFSGQVLPAVWVGEPSQRRVCTATITATTVGRHDLLVGVASGETHPLLKAGRIVVEG